MDLICREKVITNECDEITAVDQHHHNQQQQNVSNNMDSEVLVACPDPIFLYDRCLENLKKDDGKHNNLRLSYGKCHNDFTPEHRKIVADWMLEVCEERNCQEEVFLLALSYMDRFTATTAVRKTHLQSLAAACLLMASKLREPSSRGLPAELLVFYTDNSVSKYDLINWELIVLSRLKWDVSSVTPLDFLELLLTRLPIPHARCPDISRAKVKGHAQAIISMAARDHYFQIYSASTIAASSIAAALSGMKWDVRSGKTIDKLLDMLTDLTSVEQEYISTCMNKMEDLLQIHRKNLERMTPFCNENSKLVPQVPINGKMVSGTTADDIEFYKKC